MAEPIDLTAKASEHQLDVAFYDDIRAGKPAFRLAERFVIPPFSGRGFLVKGGQTFRIIEEGGPQVATLVLWNAKNPNEFFSSCRTLVAEGWQVKPNIRLWSEIHHYHPLATCIEDTVVTTPPTGEFHHHFVSSHCTPETLEMISGVGGLNSCQTNLVRAIQPFGLKEEDIHDSLNLHQKIKLDAKDLKYFAARSDGKPGDYVEFFAEMDLLAAVSVCPSGDNTRHYSTPEDGIALPIGVEIYDTGINPKPPPQWADWRKDWKGYWEPQEEES